MRTRTARRLADATVAQHGVITSPQLAELGLDLRLPRRERWPLLAPRTWATTGEVTDVQLLQAIDLYAGPDAVPSGALGCRRHGLRDVPIADGDALVPHGRHLTGGGRLRLHQTRRLPDGVERDGWTVAPVARSVADAARWTSSLTDVRALVLAAVADGHVPLSALADELDAGPRQRSAHLARALVDAGRGARSAPEAEAADCLLATPGLAPFLLNAQVWLDGELLGLPDGYLPELGLGWEVDSFRHHGGSAELDRTLSRHRRFADCGIELVHVVPAQLRRDPAGWAASVAERARRRRWRAPSGLVVVPGGPALVPRGVLAA